MNVTKPQWIIFDIGGVLNNFDKSITTTAEYLGVSKRELLHAYFKDFKEVEISKLHYKEKLREMLISLDSDKDIENVIPLLFSTETYLADSLKLVEQLYNAGYSLALLTNTWHGITEDVVANLKEFHMFKQIFDSSELGLRKPEKQIFLHVEEALDAKGKQILFVDDRLENLEIGKEFGWQTYLYEIAEDEGRKSNDTLRKLLL